MDQIDIRFFIAFLAPTIAFGYWALRRYMEDEHVRKRDARAQDNLVRALYAEIDFNTRDMEIFEAKSPSTASLSEAIFANPDLIPHITDARHTEVYRARMADIHVISDVVLHQMIDFYGYLEKIRVQIEGINLPSFRTLSDQGRLNAVDVIRRTAMDAQVCGRLLLRQLEQEYSALSLTRRSRIYATPDMSVLKKRTEELARAIDIAQRLKR